jgi:hypothetical protein
MCWYVKPEHPGHNVASMPIKTHMHVAVLHCFRACVCTAGKQLGGSKHPAHPCRRQIQLQLTRHAAMGEPTQLPQVVLPLGWYPWC